MKVIILVFAILLTGCGSTKFFQSYRIGDTKTVPVGGTIITWGVQHTSDWATSVSQLNETTAGSLIFNGMDNGMIRIGYREIYGNLYGTYAKPAMSNDLKYPTDSKVIVYLDHTLEVISVTSNEITVFCWERTSGVPENHPPVLP